MHDIVELDVVANVLEKRCRVCALWHHDREAFWRIIELSNANFSKRTIFEYLSSRTSALKNGKPIPYVTVTRHFTKILKRGGLTHAEKIQRALAIAARTEELRGRRAQIVESEPQEKAAVILNDVLDLIYQKLLLIKGMCDNGKALTESQWAMILDAMRAARSAYQSVGEAASARLKEAQTRLKAFEVQAQEKNRWREFLQWLQERLPKSLWEQMMPYLMTNDGSSTRNSARIPKQQRALS